MSAYLLLTLGLLVTGLAVGPLLGIAVDRTVERIPVRPGHRCVHCHRELGPRTLAPVAHWFRSCPDCGRGKGVRYPLVDLAAALALAAVGVRFGTGWQLAPYAGLAVILVVLSAIDIETHLLPNLIVWPAIGLALFVVLVVSGERDDAGSLYAALAGGATFGGFIGLTHLLNERGMGRGDVKLSLLLGLSVGWVQPDAVLAVRLVFYAIVVALLGGGLVGLAANLVRGRRGEEVAFGPALAAGSFTVILGAPALTG